MSESKLCPFRHIVVTRVAMVTPNIFYDVDEFAPCLEEKCAMWRTVKACVYLDASDGLRHWTWKHGCGLAGRP